MKKLFLILTVLILSFTNSASAEVISLDLEVPQEVIDAGGVELFASAYGWTPQIVDPNNETMMIDNPVSALDAGKAVVKEFVRQVTKAKHLELAQKQATESASSSFDAMFTE